jgi:hypothetical protein
VGAVSNPLRRLSAFDVFFIKAILLLLFDEFSKKSTKHYNIKEINSKWDEYKN